MEKEKTKNKKTGVNSPAFYYAAILRAFNFAASLDFLLAALLM